MPDGTDGEICVRGDVVMAGYWRNPEANARALAGGWLHTGDVGHFDTGGRLRILDRRHDTIISGGTNIYPKEIEDVLASHPRVREVAAFGVPDAEWGDVPANVRHEPVSALRGGADGLQFVRPINEGAASHLAPGGMLAVEFAESTANAVLELAKAQSGLCDLRIERDFQGRPRVLIAHRGS